MSIRTPKFVADTAKEVLDQILSSTGDVKTVDDPYVETDVNYLVIAINPSNPVIREVPKDTPDSYATLVEAKEVAREVLQNTIAEAQDSLSKLRQIGIREITYIKL